MLREHFSRKSQTGLGLITMTPKRRRLNFCNGFTVRHYRTIFEGAINTEDVIFFLTMVREYYGGKIMIIWDSLSSHLSARKHFESVHPDWFVFEQLPSYSPELNPVEQCWQMMKNVYMANFVANDVEHLERKKHSSRPSGSTMPRNCLLSFFHHAKLAL